MMTESAMKHSVNVICLVLMAAYCFILSLSNICDLLITAGLLPDFIVFRSGHLVLAEKMVDSYGLGQKTAIVLLSMLSFIELALADSFIMASFLYKNKRKEAALWVNLSFSLSILLCFFLMMFFEVLAYHQATIILVLYLILLLLCWKLLFSEK